MKTVNKLIIILFALVAIKTNALANRINTEELLNRMTNSENVSKLLNQRVSVLFSRYAENSSNTEIEKEKFRSQAEITFFESVETNKLVELEFPELAVMNEKEKTETYELLLKTPVMASRFTQVMKCIGKVLLAGVVCQFGPMAGAQIWFFGGCLWAALAFDVTAAITTGGVLLATLPTAVSLEAPVCWAAATTSTLAFGAAIVGNCLTATTFGMGVCLTF